MEMFEVLYITNLLKNIGLLGVEDLMVFLILLEYKKILKIIILYKY